MLCRNCGKELPNDWTQCDNCGCPVTQGGGSEEPHFDQSAYRLCPNCGKKLPAEMPECDNCGTPAPKIVPEVRRLLTEEAAEPEQPEKTAKKWDALRLWGRLRGSRHGWKILAAAAAAILVLAVVLALPRTVWVRTSVKSTSLGDMATYIQYDYDDAGRLIRMVTSYDFDGDIITGITSYLPTENVHRYWYNDDGTMARAELPVGYGTTWLEYEYALGGLRDVEIAFDGSGEYEIKCDIFGRIVRFSQLEDGEEEGYYAFEYYLNGALKTWTTVNGDTTVIHRYTPEGWMTEMDHRYGEKSVSRLTYAYDRKGNVIALENYSEDRLIYGAEFDVHYNGGKAESMVMRLEFEGTEEFTLTFDCQWEDLECVMTLKELNDASGQAEENLDADSFTISFSKDKAGNILSQTVVIQGNVYTQKEFTYEERVLPWDYVWRDPSCDPRYFLFLQ